MQEVTKAINATNESNFAATAQNAGGKLKSVSAYISILSLYNGSTRYGPNLKQG